MAANTVRFGLKNVYYSKITYSTATPTTPTFATPVSIPGAVSLDLAQAGELTKFYGDNAQYFVSSSNQGYEGTLEIARIPDSMLKDIWGFTEGATSKVLTENATAEPARFALLYQIDGDNDQECYVLYNCFAERPGIGSKTIEETKEVQTQSCSIVASPLANGNVIARTTADTPAATKTAWFTSVFTET